MKWWRLVSGVSFLLSSYWRVHFFLQVVFISGFIPAPGCSPEPPHTRATTILLEDSNRHDFVNQYRRYIWCAWLWRSIMDAYCANQERTKAADAHSDPALRFHRVEHRVVRCVVRDAVKSIGNIVWFTMRVMTSWRLGVSHFACGDERCRREVCDSYRQDSRQMIRERKPTDTVGLGTRGVHT